MATEDKIYTIKELSDRLRVHPTTIYRLLRRGQLPAFRVGSNWRFSRAALEKWENGQSPETFTPVARGRKKAVKVPT